MKLLTEAMKNLPRTFIYRDRKELDDFLRGNPLNEALYDVFLEVKDSYYNLKIPAEAIFNEVFYQCTRLMLDSHPEVRVWDYLNDAKTNTGWRYTSDLVFSMVYAILSLQARTSTSITRFLRILEGRNLNECYFPAFRHLVEEQLQQQKTFQSSFTPCPEPPERLFAYGTFLWSEVTDDYNQERIRMIVNLWTAKEDKLAVLDMIQDAFVFDDELRNPNNYEELPF